MHKVIIDCDPGCDEAKALFIAIAHKIDILAITTVEGSSSVDNATLNARYILRYTETNEIPVYKGCARPCNGVELNNDTCHGLNGLGDCFDYQCLASQKSNADFAVNAIIRLVARYENEVTLICTGPLTNIANALLKDALFGSKLKGCIIVGGNHENITQDYQSDVEFNFQSDPVAAGIVFDKLWTDITIIPHETCIENSLPWPWYWSILAHNNKEIEFIRKADVKYRDNAKKEGYANFPTFAELAIAIFIDNSLILEDFKLSISIDLDEGKNYGRMIVNSNRRNMKHKCINATVVSKVDKIKFWNLYWNSLVL